MVPLNDVFCVTTFEIEPFRVCFSKELECVVFRVRPSCLTSVTKSVPFAVKEPSIDHSGDGGLIFCCAAIRISGSVKR